VTTTASTTTEPAGGRSSRLGRCARAACAALAGVLLAGAHAADIDHYTARQLRASGTILPLADIVDDATRQWPGQVIETELGLENGRYIYEIEVLCIDGQIREFEYDAMSGELLEVEVED
jgi:uncharacterized membrane protein YkoI